MERIKGNGLDELTGKTELQPGIHMNVNWEK